jgi:hypothetical protein
LVGGGFFYGLVSGGEEMGFIFDEVFFRIEYFNNLLEIGE